MAKTTKPFLSPICFDLPVNRGITGYLTRLSQMNLVSLMFLSCALYLLTEYWLLLRKNKKTASLRFNHSYYLPGFLLVFVSAYYLL